MNDSSNIEQPRAAAAADLPAILGLLEACGLPPQGVAECLPECLVSTHNGGLVGAGAIEPCGASVLLRSLVVAPEWRGHGIAAGLVEALEARARAAGHGELWLLTDSAGAWFQARGYETLPRTAAPADLRAHPQFRGLCPDSAALMRRAL